MSQPSTTANFRVDEHADYESTKPWLVLQCLIWTLLVCPLTGGSADAQVSEHGSPPGVSILERSTAASELPVSESETGRSQREPARDEVDLDRLVTKLVLDNIPHDFEETKDWGQQAERWDGVKFYRQGNKIETQRRKKKVNHGTWKRYAAQLRNPQKEFTVQVKNMRGTSDEKVAFDIHFLAHLDITGRQSKWLKGVQLYSIGIHGHTQVRLTVSIELEVKMGGTSFPPDLVFVPVATDANLVIDEFRLDRIGKVGGEVAQQVSKGVRSTLDEKVAEKKDKLLTKINKQLEKKQDEFRIPVANAMKSTWTESAKAFLPASIQDSIDP